LFKSKFKEERKKGGKKEKGIGLKKKKKGKGRKK